MRPSVWQLKLDWNCIKWQWPQAQQQIYNRMVKEINTEGVTEIQTSSMTLGKPCINECLNFNGLTYHCKVRSVKLLHLKVILQQLNPGVHLVFPHTASPFWLSVSKLVLLCPHTQNLRTDNDYVLLLKVELYSLKIFSYFHWIWALDFIAMTHRSNKSFSLGRPTLSKVKLRASCYKCDQHF